MFVSRPLVFAVALGFATALAPVGVLAQVVESVGLSLTVTHASPTPGPIDPGAAELHRQLRSLHVIEQRHVKLRMQEIGGIVLPTGKRVEFRPLSLTTTGVLIAVEIPGTLQTDIRVPNRKNVVIGVDRYQNGQLILTLQPDY